MTQDPALSTLSAMLGERLITATDERYHSARALWNGGVDKRPWALVRCVSRAEVSAALRTAQAAGRSLSVRAGGHQIAGAAVVDDGLVIDLQLLRSVDVDPASGTVRVGGGSLLGDLDRACARYGVAVPAGVVSHTGVGGLALGGGIGWLCRSRGLTCDNLVSAKVVLTNGTSVEASLSEHPELHWSLRGGGGNFGIVTEFVFSAAEIGPVVHGKRSFPLDRAAEALLGLGALADRMPRELQVVARIQRSDHASSSPAGPVELVLEWLWSGPEGRREDIEALLKIGDAAEATSRTVSFLEVQSLQDHRFPHGSGYYLKPGHLATIDRPQVDILEAIAHDLPLGDCQVEIMRLGGAVSDRGEESSAFPRRDAAFAFNLVGARASDTSTYDAQVRWVQASHAALSAVGPTGAYSNFAAGTGIGLEDVFGARKLARLRDAKRTYDPGDVLRPALHIAPSETPCECL